MTRKMEFPVTLYHRDNGTPEFAADARHSKYTTYPIVVQTKDDYDRLGPGWCEDPVEAAAWTPDADEPKTPQAPDGVTEAQMQAATELLDGNVDQVIDRIEEVESAEELTLLSNVEEAGKNRKGVHAAIADRLEAVGTQS